MKIDVVFSGGGVKAFAFIGALEAIDERKLQIERTAGTSAGAILAAFLAAGFTTKEINAMLDELDLSRFLDPPPLITKIPFSKWIFLYFQRGIYKGDRLECWLAEKLAEKNIVTFADLPKGALRVIASDLTLGKLIVFPDDLQRVYHMESREFSVAKAVRMSAGFPFFFVPSKLHANTGITSQLVDGGLLSNFPLWVMSSESSRLKRPILGVKLVNKSGEVTQKKIKTAFDMCEALISTMKTAHDSRYLAKSEQHNVIVIPSGYNETLNLHIPLEKRQLLVQNGKTAAAAFLTNWPI